MMDVFHLGSEPDEEEKDKEPRDNSSAPENIMALQARIVELNQELEKIKQNLAASENVVVQLKRERKNEILKLQNLLKDRSREFKKVKHELNLHRSKKRELIVSREKNEQSSMIQVKEFTELTAQLQKDLDEKETSIQHLKKDLSEAQSLEGEKTDLEEKLKKQQEKMVHEKAMMKVLEGRIADLELKTHSDEEISLLKDKVHLLEEKNELLRQEKTGILEKQKKEHLKTEQSGNLTKKLEIWEEKFNVQKKRNAMLEENLENLNQEISSLKKENEKLQDIKKRVQELGEETDKDFKTIKRQLQKLREENKQFKEKIYKRDLRFYTISVSK